MSNILQFLFGASPEKVKQPEMRGEQTTESPTVKKLVEVVKKYKDIAEQWKQVADAYGRAETQWQEVLKSDEVSKLFASLPPPELKWVKSGIDYALGNCGFYVQRVKYVESLLKAEFINQRDADEEIRHADTANLDPSLLKKANDSINEIPIAIEKAEAIEITRQTVQKFKLAAAAWCEASNAWEEAQRLWKFNPQKNQDVAKHAQNAQEKARDLCDIGVHRYIYTERKNEAQAMCQRAEAEHAEALKQTDLAQQSVKEAREAFQQERARQEAQARQAEAERARFKAQADAGRVAKQPSIIGDFKKAIINKRPTEGVSDEYNAFKVGFLNGKCVSELLGLPPTAKKEELISELRKKQRVFHPDRLIGQSQEVLNEAAILFGLITHTIGVFR